MSNPDAFDIAPTIPSAVSVEAPAMLDARSPERGRSESSGLVVTGEKENLGRIPEAVING
jgi:hypothetical protein